MQAIRHHTFAPADVLHLEELRDLHPAPTQLRIAVEASGVHLLDTATRAGESFGVGTGKVVPVVDR